MWDIKIETWSYLSLSVLLCKDFGLFKESHRYSLKLTSDENQKVLHWAFKTLHLYI